MSPVLVIATGTVTGQVVNSLGNPVAGIPVTAKLNAGASTPQTISPAGQQVPGEVSTFTDPTGAWSLALVPNANINPSNSTYLIQIPGMPDVAISLPDTASHPYLSIAVSPTSATLLPVGQTVAALTVTSTLTASAGLNVAGAAAFHGPEPWYDVKHPTFGAVGNGVADDTTAIAAALTAAGSTGGIVFVPPGTYRLSARLVVPFNVSLRGAGRNSSFLQALGTFPTNTELVRLGDLSGNIGIGCRIEEMSVDCLNISGSIGIYSERINENSGVYRCVVINYGSRGIQIKQPAAGGLPQHWTIDDVEIYSGTGTGASAIGLDVATTSLGIVAREINAVTVNATGHTQLTVGIKLDGLFCEVRNTHVENAVTGILIGSVQACFGLLVHTVDGLSTVTNLVTISNATSSRSITLLNILLSGGTNSIVDQINGNTLTREVASYIFGAGCVWISDFTFGSNALVSKFGRLKVQGDLAMTGQFPTEAVLVSGVDCSLGNMVLVGLTANRVVGAPINPSAGDILIFTLIQDGTGGRTITWNAIFKGLTWSDAGNTANKRSTITFWYDGGNWNQVGAQAPYAT